MASFYDNFSGNLDNWIPSIIAPVNRNWFISGGLLKVADKNTSYGLILYKNLIDVDGKVIVNYNNLDLYNGTDNLIVLRYTDNTHFNYISIQAGTDQYDDRGIVFGYNALNQLTPNVILYNSNGTLLDQEIVPNKTPIPQTGIIDITFTGNKYDIVIYDNTNTFLASGTYIDTLNNNITSGYIGFGHTEKWGANINGWDSISVVDYAPAIVSPIITSFSATDYYINIGESTTLNWNVSSGTDITNVYLTSPINSAVPLNGTYTLYPTTGTTYGLSAWSNVGNDYDSFIVNVSEEFPIILDYYNNGPIPVNSSAILNWNISASTSAIINNGIGWITPYTSAGSISTSALLYDTTYYISAYDVDGDISTASTLVTVIQLPTASLSIYGVPTCSGSTYTLAWESQYGTSAFLDNGIGNVPLSGTYTVDATTPINHVLTVTNDIGQVSVNKNAMVYYRAPYAYIGDDVYTSTMTGSAYVVLDSYNCYDVDGLPLSFTWFVDSIPVSDLPLFEYDYVPGVHTVDLYIENSCGFSAMNSIIVDVKGLILPLANIYVEKQYLSSPGLITLDGSHSSDYDGYLAVFAWYNGNTFIGNTPIIEYFVSNPINNIRLVVFDDDGLSSEATVDIYITDEVLPIADAGLDASYCSTGLTTVTLVGSNSIPPIYPVGSKITYFEYNLSNFGLPNVASYITDVSEISATFKTNLTGTFFATLRVVSDNGYSSSYEDSVYITLHNRPTISASPDVYEVLTIANTDVHLSAFSDSISASYNWTYNIGSSVNISTEQFLTLNLGAGIYYANVNVTDNDTGCTSDTQTINIELVDNIVEILYFNIDPEYKKTYFDIPIFVNLSWETKNATSAYIDGIGYVNPSGSMLYPTPITETSNVSFSIIAFNDNSAVNSSKVGQYIFNTSNKFGLPLETSCKLRENVVVTYGLDELKYGKNRPINLVNYLPEYIRQTDTEILLAKFEGYMNNMFKGQSNYTLTEDTLPVVVNTTHTYNQYTCCNDIKLSACNNINCSGTCNNRPTSGSTNTYVFNNGLDIKTTNTPSYDVSEIIIDNACSITDDKISILDKIYRLTDLLDPDLIPIEFIQHYGENLGYQAGISRESIYASYNESLGDFQQKRYLRFMMQNLPNWYQIKSTPSAIAIMLYSFGLVGNFVYYYTRCYTDKYDPDSNGICDDTDATLAIIDRIDAGKVCFGNSCDSLETYNIDSYDQYAISSNRCCLEKYKYDSLIYITKINKLHKFGNNDWILTELNEKQLTEDLTPVYIEENLAPGYFSTPHFHVLVDLIASTGDFSLDVERQRTMSIALDAIKPINTVYDGISLYFNAGPVIMYMRGLSINRSHKIIIPFNTP